MFETGQFIIYGNTGVCKVTEIKKMTPPGTKTDRLYYSLEPVYDSAGHVFTPVDNQKVVMRPVLTEAEARSLIGRLQDIDTMWITDEKHREDSYKEAIRTCDCEEWVRIIKTLYSRKKSRLAQGKKVTSSDARYLHLAEDNLYGELSVALGIPRERVESYLLSQMEGGTQMQPEIQS